MTATHPTSQSLARILSIRVRRALIVQLLVSTAIGVLGLVALQWAQAREDFLQIVKGLESGALTDLQNNDKWTSDSRLLSQAGIDGILEIAIFRNDGERFSSVQNPPGRLASRFPLLRKAELALSSKVDHALVAPNGFAWGAVRLSYVPIRAIRAAALLGILLLCQAALATLWVRRAVEAATQKATKRLESLVRKVESLSAEKSEILRNPAQVLEPGPQDDDLPFEVALLEKTLHDFALEAMEARMSALEGERHRAVAQLTQMLAHDVRKPFSMFTSIIQIVERTSDPSQVREVLRMTLPEVNQAMASVEGMLTDVMQMGSELTPISEDAAPQTLIEAALGELFRIYHEADVTLSYEFSHHHMVRADTLQVGRVFANILGNAVQAIREKGSLWFRTTEYDDVVEFALGNGGSLISPEILPKLFDAFFTSDKKGGTGLGLAIAKKIVESHGGTIRCVSEKTDKYPAGMVEFIFTLPVSRCPTPGRSDALPISSREIQAALATVRIAAARQGNTGPDPLEAEIEADVLERLRALDLAKSNPATVLVVEDEAVYRNGILSLLNRSEDLASQIRLVFAKSDAEALAAVHEHAPVLVIEDVDLGPSSKDGIEIVKLLRERGFAGHICVHSNRFLAGDNKAALAAGADSVLPKPLGRAHFLKLILAALPEPTEMPPAASITPQLLTVAMLDDSISMRMAWKMNLARETSFRSFASTGAFFAACEGEPTYLSEIDVVITDYNFAPGDPHDGGTVARELRVRGYAGIILRASGETDLGPEIEALFDGDVGKGALGWSDFYAEVESARARRKRT